MSRETRLLLATVMVSALVLLALSRFRFPERPAIVAAPGAPLERLAARATFDELARIVAAVAPQISPNLVVLRPTPEGLGEPRTLADALGPTARGALTSHLPGLRVGETTAIAAVAADVRFLGDGDSPGGSAPQLMVADPLRRLAMVRVPPDPTGRVRNTTLGELRTPTYVVAVEGTRSGLSFRPLFVGATGRFVDRRWESPLLDLGSAALVSPGSLLFSLEGQFLGLVVAGEGSLAIAEAREVVATADRLAALGSGPLFDAGISVQALTSELAAALGVERGVVIAEVDPRGPAADVLESLDVITVLGGRPVDSTDDLLLRLARPMPDGDVAMTVIRDGESLLVSIDQSSSYESPDSTLLSGLELTSQPSVGTIVGSVGTALETAGVRPGDVIVRVGEVPRPTPAQLRATIRGLAPGAYLTLTLDRAGRRRILAIAAPAAAAEADVPQ